MLGADSCDRPAPRRGAQMRSCAYMLCSEKLKKPGSVPNCDKRHLYLVVRAGVGRRRELAKEQHLAGHQPSMLVRSSERMSS